MGASLAWGVSSPYPKDVPNWVKFPSLFQESLAEEDPTSTKGSLMDLPCESQKMKLDGLGNHQSSRMKFLSD